VHFWQLAFRATYVLLNEFIERILHFQGAKLSHQKMAHSTTLLFRYIRGTFLAGKEFKNKLYAYV
jgi:hypothetical protein